MIRIGWTEPGSFGNRNSERCKAKEVKPMIKFVAKKKLSVAITRSTFFTAVVIDLRF